MLVRRVGWGGWGCCGARRLALLGQANRMRRFGDGEFGLPLVAGSSSVQAVFASVFLVELCLFFGVKGFEVVVDCWVGVVGAVVVDVLFCFYVYAAVLCLCSEGCSLVALVHGFA